MGSIDSERFSIRSVSPLRMASIALDSQRSRFTDTVIRFSWARCLTQRVPCNCGSTSKGHLHGKPTHATQNGPFECCFPPGLVQWYSRLLLPSVRHLCTSNTK